MTVLTEIQTRAGLKASRGVKHARHNACDSTAGTYLEGPTHRGEPSAGCKAEGGGGEVLNVDGVSV